MVNKNGIDLDVDGPIINLKEFQFMQKKGNEQGRSLARGILQDANGMGST